MVTSFVLERESEEGRTGMRMHLCCAFAAAKLLVTCLTGGKRMSKCVERKVTSFWIFTGADFHHLLFTLEKTSPGDCKCVCMRMLSVDVECAPHAHPRAFAVMQCNFYLGP